jgi:hypothetical protein
VSRFRRMKNSTPQLLRINTVVVLVALLSASCLTSPRQASSGSCPTPMAELGVIALSASIPKIVSLGAGTNCTITPTVLPGGELQLELAVETPIADSTATRLCQTRFTARLGVHHTVSVGELLIGLTPTLKAE